MLKHLINIYLLCMFYIMIMVCFFYEVIQINQ